MGATNTNVNAVDIIPLALTTNSKYQLGIIDSAAKAAANDTWTLKNGSDVIAGFGADDATGVAEAIVVSSNTLMTLKEAGATGAHTALIIYKKN